jgi:hypothetical protein
VLLGGGVAGVLSLLLLAYCFLDVATSRSADVRTLPKPLWFAVVVLLPVLGPVAWLLAGRPKPGTPRAVPRVLPPEAGPATAPDDDEAFLRSLRQRAEEQRRRDEEQRRDEGGQPS